jgi:hypothetical protein
MGNLRHRCARWKKQAERLANPADHCSDRDNLGPVVAAILHPPRIPRTVLAGASGQPVTYDMLFMENYEWRWVRNLALENCGLVQAGVNVSVAALFSSNRA